MSRIYFTAPHREAKVYGSERAWLGALTQRIAWGLMEPYVGETLKDCDLVEHAVGFDSLDEIAREPDPFSRRMLAKQRFHTWASVGGWSGREAGMRVGDSVIPMWEFCTNTAMAVGNDIIKLAGKIHGTCEDFAWIASEDCRWFAGLVREAREAGVFRPNAGWEDVLNLVYEVGETGNGPIVTHYSVSESFPSSYAAENTWSPPECRSCIDSDDPGYINDEPCPDCFGEPRIWDAWYDLEPEEQWELSVESIKQRRFDRQISPETLRVPFYYGENLFHLIGKAVHPIPPTG